MTKKEISALIKQTIRRRKLSYYAVSKASGLTVAGIHRIENNEGYEVESLVKICNALELEVTLIEK